jgi:hypothetical protein
MVVHGCHKQISHAVAFHMALQKVQNRLFCLDEELTTYCFYCHPSSVLCHLSGATHFLHPTHSMKVKRSSSIFLLLAFPDEPAIFQIARTVPAEP